MTRTYIDSDGNNCIVFCRKRDAYKYYEKAIRKNMIEARKHLENPSYKPVWEKVGHIEK